MQPGLSAFDVTAFSVMFIVGGFAGAWVGLYPFHEAIRGSIFTVGFGGFLAIRAVLKASASQESE